MSDFFKIDTRPGKRGVTEIYPKFIVGKPNDLMIRGSDFYAIWMEERGLWSTDEQDVIRTIDRELRIYADEYQKTHDKASSQTRWWIWKTKSPALLPVKYPTRQKRALAL